MVAHNILLLSYASLMLAILWITFRSYRGWRIGRWARFHGYELISFQMAKVHAGYTAWYRSENRPEYRIVVLDSDSQKRYGWLSFDRGLPLRRKVKIAWDDAPQL
jgi:hypothetical protein